MTWIIIIVLIIVVAVLTLPFFVKAMLNRTLRKMDGYTGRVDQLRINLFQSKISGHNISIDNELRGGKPLAQVPAIIIYFKWRRLLSGILDLNIVVDRPKLFLVAEKTL